MKCKECGRQMYEYWTPGPIFKIPFTRYEVWGWSKVWACVECETDKQNAEESHIYEAGFEDGYEKGLRNEN